MTSPLRTTAATLASIALARGLRAVDAGPRIAKRLGFSSEPTLPGVVLERLIRAAILHWGPRWGGDDGSAPPEEGALRWSEGLKFVAGFCALALPASARHAKRPDIRARYPRVRAPKWGVVTHSLNAASWTLYLIAYEEVFRRTLRSTLRGLCPPKLAEALAVIIYALDHAPVSREEFLGSFATGPIFSSATRWTGSTLPAAVAHAVMAIAHDLVAERGLSDPETSAP